MRAFFLASSSAPADPGAALPNLASLSFSLSCMALDGAFAFAAPADAFPAASNPKRLARSAFFSSTVGGMPNLSARAFFFSCTTSFVTIPKRLARARRRSSSVISVTPFSAPATMAAEPLRASPTAVGVSVARALASTPSNAAPSTAGKASSSPSAALCSAACKRSSSTCLVPVVSRPRSNSCSRSSATLSFASPDILSLAGLLPPHSALRRS
mmetsp:Transcript_33911/g.60576  ORF Transcript_33911/g.60576 Transcript_33911/m.60576 type:complete len:213 (-) Transcript_33911:163-801(-)